LKEKTQLEIACEEVVGTETNQYYSILSDLLIMNPHLLKDDDTRLSAQLTSILFSEEVEDKAHLICSIIETFDLQSKDKYVEQAKSLLEIDPVLEITKQIIEKLKNLPDPNYSEIMRKVNIKHELKLYRDQAGYTKSKI
jgi:hypothetical protein